MALNLEARFNSGANFTTLPETRITEVARIVRCNHFVRFVICCRARTNKQAMRTMFSQYMYKNQGAGR